MNEAGIAQYVSELNVCPEAGETFKTKFFARSAELGIEIDPRLPIMDKLVGLNCVRTEQYLREFDEFWFLYRAAAPTCLSFHKLRCDYRGIDDIERLVRDLRSCYINLIAAVELWGSAKPAFWLSYQDLLNPETRARIFGSELGRSGKYQLNAASGVIGIGDPTAITTGIVQERNEAANAEEARRTLKKVADIEEIEFLAAVYLAQLKKRAAPVPAFSGKQQTQATP